MPELNIKNIQREQTLTHIIAERDVTILNLIQELSNERRKNEKLREQIGKANDDSST